MSLPNPGMNFTAFATLPASDLNDLVENIEALAAGTGFDAGAIGTTDIADGAITSPKLARTVAAGNGATITGTGNYVVTGIGFEPRVIEIWGGINSNGSNASYCHGVYDRVAGTQGVVFSAVQSGSFGSGSLTTHVFRVDAPLNTILARGTISATSSDGFTLNIDTYSAANSAWRWVAHA